MIHFIKACLFLLTVLGTLHLQAQDDLYRLNGKLLGETPIEEDLQELCDHIGGRVTGSKANEKAVQWALNKFKEAGVKSWKESFTMPVLWLPEATDVDINGAINFKPKVVAKYQSPPGNYRSELLYLGMGQAADFEKAGKSVAGKFIIVEADLCFDINGLFTEYGMAAATEKLALEYQAKGIVFMASRPKGLLYRFITSKTTNNQMPQIVMAREDAKRCIRLSLIHI